MTAQPQLQPAAGTTATGTIRAYPGLRARTTWRAATPCTDADAELFLRAAGAWWRAHGIGEALAGPELPLFGIADIEPAGKYFAWHGSVRAVLCGEWQDDELVDVIAIDLAKPERWWRRNGTAWALGGALVRVHADRGLWLPDDEPLRLHASPRAWLLAGGDGVAVLDWQAGEVSTLFSVPRILADQATADRLAAEYWRRHAPRFELMVAA